MGFDAVMSEFGDIFYDPLMHVQDACKEEVSRCHLFVLVIGNNYGSIYHKDRKTLDVPDSVTLQEFRKALEVGIPKFIFVNRFVLHDFGNYRRSLEKEYVKHFQRSDIPNEDVDAAKDAIKKTFDTTYPFPQDPYRYIFYFLEIVDDLKTNNAVLTFESFDDIRDLLRRQWAGMFYDSITKNKQVSVERFSEVLDKLDLVERQLRAIVDSRTSSESNSQHITLDIKRIAAEFESEELEALQTKIFDHLNEMIYSDDGPRVVFRVEWDSAKALQWIDSLSQVIQKYKWSKHVPVDILFAVTPKYAYWKERQNVPSRAVWEFFAIASRLGSDDKVALCNTIVERFNQRYEPEKPKLIPPPDDEIPF